MEQKLPEKKIPSTAANAINLSAKLGESIHFKAHSAFSLIAGKFSIALNNQFRPTKGFWSNEEIRLSEDIGLSSNKLVLGKHSGRHALRERIKEIGYELSDEELKIVFDKFKDLVDKKKHVMDEDLEAIVNEGVLRTPDIFVLEYLHVSAGSTVMPMASVQIAINGRSVKDAGYGNGPIDACYNTIAKLTGTTSELLRFTVPRDFEGS